MSDLHIVPQLYNPTEVGYVQPGQIAMTLELDEEPNISDGLDMSDLGLVPRLSGIRWKYLTRSNISDKPEFFGNRNIWNF
jgi:hypothetical protein